MREILFRGYTGRNWQYGYLIDKEAIRNFDKNGLPISTYRVIEKTIGQYTERKDKNKIKIFEGDIVKGNFPYAEKCVVVWDNKRCGFYLKPITHWGKASTDKYYKLNSCVLEIIGNIYDNPELLEA